MLFKKKDGDRGKNADTPNQQGEQQAGQPLAFTKQKRFFGFKIKSKPIYGPQMLQEKMNELQAKQQAEAAKQQGSSMAPAHEAKKYTPFQIFLAQTAAKHPELELALVEQGIKVSPYDFVKKMFTYAAVLAVVLAVVLSAVLSTLLYSVSSGIVFGMTLGLAVFYAFFNKFMSYPVDRSRNIGKDVERDILFAMRDIVIGMRSGMPLYNAMTAVSSGYGSASKEFRKIVELVQLGQPIDKAIEDVSRRSLSKTFKRMTLQASVSIRSGADIVSALQGVLDEVSQERVIELRRYGQRLNALAMFYMLFGVIFPSMGIAVAVILTTFISIFTINATTLIAALVGIFFLQMVFLNIMRTSRPTFAM
ncbi:MAG: type II secretion system F family protein [Candidatus Micrarchaeota archaeon]|nr:type II secretion system F family protein [Candidatus Micrarchaeota archaeon]MDE1847766.1 type II secretion system F family protein [Candidatus Micrarchaeota archaeon]MDE1863909.1 type II secretion system F family protein [Candidatus Micrarchaeota archaeon]